MANLDRVKTESKAVLISGHIDIFSAGFDLNFIETGPEASQSLVSGDFISIDYLIGALGEFVL